MQTRQLNCFNNLIITIANILKYCANLNSFKVEPSTLHHGSHLKLNSNFRVDTLVTFELSHHLSSPWLECRSEKHHRPKMPVLKNIIETTRDITLKKQDDSEKLFAPTLRGVIQIFLSSSKVFLIDYLSLRSF